MNTTLEHKSQTANQRAQQHENQSAKAYPSRTIVHAKLEMTEPGDHDEREADAIANTVMSGGKIARKISSGGSGSSGIAVSSQMESQLNHLQGGGQSMPEGLRSMMESGFGHDFSQVRLHTDSEAASMNNSIHAKAFTLGNDIYFNRGQFAPETSEGQHLVAHELTHVVQGIGKIARENKEDLSNDLFDDIWNNYPFNWGQVQHDTKNENYTPVFTKLENTIASIIYDYTNNYTDNKEENQKKLALLLERLEDKDIREKTKTFINNYNNQLLELKGKYSDVYYIYGNIVRQVLLYDFNHFEKHKTTIKLEQERHGCGARLSIALAKAGIKIKNGGQSYFAKGYNYYDVGKKFPVMNGPSVFADALKSQKKLKPIISVKLTSDAFDQTQSEDSEKKKVEKYLIKLLQEPMSDLFYIGITVERNDEKIKEYKLKLNNGEYHYPKGIIVMETDAWSHDAGGHVTLWNGEQAADNLDVEFLNPPKHQTYKLYDVNDILWESL